MPQPTNHPVNLDPFAPPTPKVSNCPHSAHPTLSQRKQDAVIWHCHLDFKIVNIRQRNDDPSRPFNAARPDNPFYRVLPFEAYSDGGSPPRFQVNSGPAQPTAVGGAYQVTFEAGGELRDPHFDVDGI